METLSSSLQPFFEWLWRATLQASLLICLILMIQLVLGTKLGVRWRYCLWLLLLLRMALPWAPQSRLSLSNVIPQRGRQAPMEYARQEVANDKASSGSPGVGVGESTPASATKVTQDTAEAPALLPDVPKEAGRQLRTHSLELADVLPLVWLAGALILGVYVCVNNFTLLSIVRRQRPLTEQKILELLEDCKSQMGIRTILGLVVSDKVKSPALFGFVRPRLLVPKGMLETLSCEELRYVFLHELGHLKRHDIYLGWLMSLLQVLHWFNPLIWLAFYRMRADRELACDALVLARTQSGQARDYGRTIVSLLERFSRSQALPAMAGILETKTQLKRRIKMIARFQKNSYRWSPLAVILLIIIGCVSLPDAIGSKTLGISWPESEPSISLRRIKTGSMSDFSSPPSLDGRYLCDVQSHATRLVIRDLVTGEDRPLTEVSEGILWYPVISPESRHVAYIHQSLPWSSPKNELHLIRMDGTGHRVLYRFKEGEQFRIRTWTPDGKQILGIFRRGGEDVQLVGFSAKEGSMQVIHTFKTYPPGWLGRLAISPDGRYIAYDRPQKKRSWDGDIFILDIEHQQTERVVQHPAHDRLLGWTPDGSCIFFASSRRQGLPGGFTVTDTWDAYLLPVAEGRQQGAPELIKRDIPSKIRPKGFTRDGAYYYAIEFRTIEAVVAKLDLQTGKLLTKPHAVGQTGAGQIPAWSPDGRYLAYCVHQLDDSQTIRIQNMATGQERELDPNLPHFRWLRWSPDGKSLLVSNFDKKLPQAIYRINASTGERVTVVQSESSDTLLGRPQLSLDGSKLFYVLRHPDSKKVSLVIRDLESSGEKELFSLDGTLSFALSPDGQQLALATQKEKSSGVAAVNRILIMPAKGGEPKELWKTEEQITRPTIAWTPDGQSLLFTKRIPEGGRELWLVPAGGGQARKLCGPQEMRLPEMTYGGVYGALDVHPDGQRIAFDCFEYRHEVWVMENFLPGAPVAKPAEQITLRQVWSGTGVDLCGAPSPDGRYLSYVDWETGDLAIYEIATGKKRLLTNKGSWDKSVEFALFSRWSPDSKQIVYDWYNENDFAELRIIGLDGSKPRILYSNEEVAWAQTYDWSQDGKQILACFSKKEGPDQIVLVSVADGSVRVLKTLGLRGPMNMCFSPDGRYIVYDFPPEKYSAERDISLLPVDGAPGIPLIEHPADDIVLGWAPDGKNILFASDRTGNFDVWAIQFARGKPQGVPELVKRDIGRRFLPLRFTKDGSFYYGIREVGQDVYIATLDPKTGKIVVPPKKAVKRFEGANIAPYYSPDGKYLAYISRLGLLSPSPSRSRRHIHCIRTLETGKERDFTFNLNLISASIPRWSPDCRWLLARGTDNKNRGGIFQVDAQTGDTTPVVLFKEGISGRSYEWSPDGNSVFYTLGDGRILVRELETGTEDELYRLSSEICTKISVSPDGKWLALRSQQPDNDLRSLKVMPVTGGEPRELCKFEKWEEGATTFTWTADGKYILFARKKSKKDDSKRELCRIPADGGEIEKLGLEMLQISSLSVHPDGQHIAFQSSGFKRESAEVWVMENFLPAGE